MFNRLIQGSAADIMKKAMVDSFEAGVFDTEYLIPSLTVHDELDGSVSENKHGVEALRELTNIMETCVKMKVPIKCDSEVGENWGELKPFTQWAKQYE
jgi:DNA polymerase-1